MNNEDTHKLETFSNNDITYIYDSSRINIEQAELAREVVEFKENTLKNPAKDFNQIMRSKSSDWLILSASFLLLKKNADGTYSEFNRDLAISEAEPFVKKLPVKDLNRLKECVLNFFQDTELYSTILELSSSKSKTNVSETVLLKLLEQTITKNASEHISNANI